MPSPLREPAHTDPTRRHDFVLLFDVTDGNPNGDPDAGNYPRVDPETMQGLVTDVCLKRKVRNYVLLSRPNGTDSHGGDGARYDIYVKEGSVLNQAHARAHEATQLAPSSPRTLALPAHLVKTFVPRGRPAALPEEFRLEKAGASWVLRYCGSGDPASARGALAAVGDTLGEAAREFCLGLVQGAAGGRPKWEEVEPARAWMCRQFYDVRAFGAVMATSVNCGQVRGPLQLTFARSIDPVVPLDLSITRVAVTREEDVAKRRTMGRKVLIPYGLYRGHGFFNPHFASRTGFGRADLELFWEALHGMWELDRAAARGLMALRGLYVFTHKNPLGNAPAHELFDRVSVRRKPGVEVPRRFTDYEVLLAGAGAEVAPQQSLPPGVTLTGSPVLGEWRSEGEAGVGQTGSQRTLEVAATHS